MAVKPEDLDEDTSPNDNDIVMKTNSNHATRTIKFSNIWSWIWTKVYNKIISSEVTLHAIDEAKPYQPVDSTAVINSTISVLDTSKPDPVNSTAVNGALTDKSPWRTYTKYTIGGNTGDIALSVSDLNVSGLIRGFMISAMNQNNVWLNETWFNTSYLDYNAKIFHLNNPSNFTLKYITVTIFYSDTY